MTPARLVVGGVQIVTPRGLRLGKTDADQAVLTLACWDGLTAGEIAEILQITPSAVRQRLGRARERLRQALVIHHPAADRAASS